MNLSKVPTFKYILDCQSLTDKQKTAVCVMIGRAMHGNKVTDSWNNYLAIEGDHDCYSHSFLWFIKTLFEFHNRNAKYSNCVSFSDFAANYAHNNTVGLKLYGGLDRPSPGFVQDLKRVISRDTEYRRICPQVIIASRKLHKELADPGICVLIKLPNSIDRQLGYGLSDLLKKEKKRVLAIVIDAYERAVKDNSAVFDQDK